MNKQQEALKLALEALQECRRDPRLKYEHSYYDKTIAAIREAMAEQPANKPWVGLTLKEIDEYAYGSLGRQALCCAIETKLREKNA